MQFFISDSSGSGKTHAVVAGVLDKPLNDWILLDDAYHRPVGVDSISVANGANGFIQINYPSLAAVRVVSFVAVADETFAGEYDFGASVGLQAAQISLWRTPPTVEGNVGYEGGQWNILAHSGSPVVAGWNADEGALRISHQYTVWGYPHVTGRHGAMVPQLGSAGYDWFEIKWFNWGGGHIMSPVAGMDANFYRPGGYRTRIDPTTVPTGSNGNIWFYGIFER